MNHDIKTLLLNIIAGIISYYVVKFLDTNNLPILSYSVFVLYLLFIISSSYFHFQQSKKIIPLENKSKNDSGNNETNDKKDIIHEILKNVVMLSSQHIDATPKVIAEYVKEDPEIILSYLKKMADDFLVVYANNGKPPNIEVPFFVARHENPWKMLKIQKDNNALHGTAYRRP